MTAASDAITATQPFQLYLTVRNGLSAIGFYQRAFGAEVAQKQMADDGRRVLHAALRLMGQEIMLSDEFPEHQQRVLSPAGANGTTVTIHVQFSSREDVDTAITRAARHGAEIAMPASEMFWGAYYGRIVDPFGHAWSFAAD